MNKMDRIMSAILIGGLLLVTAVSVHSSDFQLTSGILSSTGTETLNVAATVTVTFSTPQADTNYSISLDGDKNETFWWTSKTETGFIINSTNPFSTATVDWILVRD